jgi:hypothetical protein
LGHGDENFVSIIVKDEATGEKIECVRKIWDLKLGKFVEAPDEAADPSKLEFYAWPAEVIDQIIKSTKNAELAVLARLHELWVLNRGKNPIALSNSGLKGITPDSKRRALEALVESGQITIQKRERNSPLITLKWKKLRD